MTDSDLTKEFTKKYLRVFGDEICQPSDDARRQRGLVALGAIFGWFVPSHERPDAGALFRLIMQDGVTQSTFDRGMEVLSHYGLLSPGEKGGEDQAEDQVEEDEVETVDPDVLLLQILRDLKKVEKDEKKIIPMLQGLLRPKVVCSSSHQMEYERLAEVTGLLLEADLRILKLVEAFLREEE